MGGAGVIREQRDSRRTAQPRQLRVDPVFVLPVDVVLPQVMPRNTQQVELDGDGDLAAAGPAHRRYLLRLAAQLAGRDVHERDPGFPGKPQRKLPIHAVGEY